MILNVTKIKKKIFDFLPILCAVFGYIIGAIFFMIYGYGKNSMLPYDILSSFESGLSLKSILSVYMGEVKFLVLIFLCGLCTFSTFTSGAILTFKGFTSGYCALYIWGLSTDLKNYLVYSVASSFSLTLSAFMCRVACDLPNLIEKKECSRSVLFFHYAFDFLLLCGVLLILTVLSRVIYNI